MRITTASLPQPRFVHATHVAACAPGSQARKSTHVGFEPTRGDLIGLAGRRLNHSAKASMPSINHNVTAVKQAAFTWREKRSTANVGAKTKR